MQPLTSELLRIDPMTGCKNFLAFLEAGLNCSLSDLQRNISTTIIETSMVNRTAHFGILFVEVKGLKFLNQAKGFSYGDSVIRWMGILLMEECSQVVFRIGGDEFGVFLSLDMDVEYSKLLDRIVERMKREAPPLGFPDFPADIALIVYDQTPTSLDSMLMQMGEAMVRVKNSAESHCMMFRSTDFKISAQAPLRWKPASETDVSFAVRWLSRKNVYQVLVMGRNLEQIQQEAYTDAVSGLPNMKSALLHLEQALQQASTQDTFFSMLMIDGDNIRQYNRINYAAGDEMIRLLSGVLKDHLRLNDFVARWRTGDEFLIILPDTSAESAKIIGERFRLAVKEASRTWRFPVTISIGVAAYPAHGGDIQALIDKTEAANKSAKDHGKDRVVVAE